ncbi:hypothetical protein [Hymenobacter rubripertinctus]|uniref:Uncharacterized protein n=1 Tax=Hymenobacter rubripertinctus TaxID=2029981 RepID=A0A418R2Z3_9BACT|nr:hypothetical protein [Hymenobacter rubripertinctus]RIY11793.1 hypothetical protein D0T11_06435 [Hymenobacter rubripertinctus]
MRKLAAPVCRIVQRPVPGSPLGAGTYLTLMRCPGNAWAVLLLGGRAAGLRAALRAACRAQCSSTCRRCRPP